MGIDIIKEGNTCEWCGNTQEKNCKLTDVEGVIGKISVCDECIEKDKKAKVIKCHKCKGFVWKLGGLRNYNDEHYCVECYDKAKEKEQTRLNQLKFLRKNWDKWIFIGLGVIAVYFAVFA